MITNYFSTTLCTPTVLQQWLITRDYTHGNLRKGIQSHELANARSTGQMLVSFLNATKHVYVAGLVPVISQTIGTTTAAATRIAVPSFVEVRFLHCPTIRSANCFGKPG